MTVLLGDCCIRISQVSRGYVTFHCAGITDTARPIITRCVIMTEYIDSAAEQVVDMRGGWADPDLFL